MKIYLMYSRAELHEAARQIWEKNPFVKHWPMRQIDSVVDVVDQIKADIRKHGLHNARVILEERQGKKDFDGWQSNLGTGGYYLSFYDDTGTDTDLVRISVQIRIDPALGCPEKAYVEELIDTIE